MDPKLVSYVVRMLRGGLRLGLMALVMMGVGWIMEKALKPDTFGYLEKLQGQALAAVESINPLQFKDRYLCALTPSIRSLNRPPARFQLSVVGDCMYTLSNVPHTGTVLPPPVVGHWADGDTSIMMPFMAFLDTGWHLIVQPSIFASIFSIFAFVIGAMAAGIAMASVRFTWHPYFGVIVFAAGTIAASCLVALCLQWLMEGGLFLFGSITHLAGACCGAAGVTFFGYSFFMKTVEVRIHQGVEEILPK